MVIRGLELGLGRSDGMGIEGMGNLFGYEGWKEWVRLVV